MNGSPLFTGDSGSGESEIRRFILENDLLEALIALPEQLFYNTGIATYVWLLSNRKAPARRGRVQLIDATSFWSPMRRSLGDKRREIPPQKAADVLKLLVDLEDRVIRMIGKDGKEEERVVGRVYPPTHFGYRRITVERPLCLKFQASPDRIARRKEQRGFQNLAKSRKRGEAGSREEAEGRARQQDILAFLERFPAARYMDRKLFLAELTNAAGEAGVRLPATIRNAILAAQYLDRPRPQGPQACNPAGSGAHRSLLRPDAYLRCAPPLRARCAVPHHLSCPHRGGLIPVLQQVRARHRARSAG